MNKKVIIYVFRQIKMDFGRCISKVNTYPDIVYALVKNRNRLLYLTQFNANIINDWKVILTVFKENNYLYIVYIDRHITGLFSVSLFIFTPQLSLQTGTYSLEVSFSSK